MGKLCGLDAWQGCVYVLGFFCLLRVCFLYSSKDPGKRFTTPSPHTWMSEHT